MFEPWVGKISLSRKWPPAPVLCWKIPWTEQPGRLPSRVEHNWARMHNSLVRLFFNSFGSNYPAQKNIWGNQDQARKIRKRIKRMATQDHQSQGHPWVVINSAMSTDSYLILDTMLGVEGNMKTRKFQDRGHKRRGRNSRNKSCLFH